MGMWADLSTELRQILSLRTFPIGWKRLETVDHLEAIPRVRRINHPVLFCQVITLARVNGWTVGVIREQLGERYKSVTGFYPSTEEHEKIRVGYWLSSDQDAASATQAGLTEDKIQEIPNWKTSNVFDPREKLAFGFAEKLAFDPKSIDDTFFDELKGSFTEPEILELGMMIGQYIGFGRFIKALDLEEKHCPMG